MHVASDGHFREEHSRKRGDRKEASSVEVRLTNDFSNGSLHDSWNDILAQMPGANAQLTHEWLSSWWEVFGDNRRLSLMTVIDGRQILGIAPLTITNVIDKAGFTLRKLTFIGDGLTDYQDFLIADERREEVLRALINSIVDGSEDWDAIHFRNMRGDSPDLPILREAFGETSLELVERVNIRSPYIPIDRPWTEYYGALGKNLRSEIRRRLNHLARMGKAEFIRLHEIDDVAGALDTIKSIHVKCRRAKGEISSYMNEKRFRFAFLILKRFGDRKWLDIVFLKLNDQVIAYYLGFIYGNIVYFWNTGWDPEFSAASPGKLLLHYWIQDSFAQGYREFDFMVGEEPYKLQWTNLVRPNYELFVSKKTVRSHLLKCYHACKPVLKKNRCLSRIGAGIGSRIRQ
jgi:CelD/BcsL family acetyltransferase involved in cellulose biosynthesis